MACAATVPPLGPRCRCHTVANLTYLDKEQAQELIEETPPLNAEAWLCAMLEASTGLDFGLHKQTAALVVASR